MLGLSWNLLSIRYTRSTLCGGPSFYNVFTLLLALHPIQLVVIVREITLLSSAKSFLLWCLYATVEGHVAALQTLLLWIYILVFEVDVYDYKERRDRVRHTSATRSLPSDVSIHIFPR